MSFMRRLRDVFWGRAVHVRHIRIGTVETRPMTPEEIAAFDAAFDRMDDAFEAMNKAFKGLRP